MALEYNVKVNGMKNVECRFGDSRLVDVKREGERFIREYSCKININITNVNIRVSLFVIDQ